MPLNSSRTCLVESTETADTKRVVLSITYKAATNKEHGTKPRLL